MRPMRRVIGGSEDSRAAGASAVGAALAAHSLVAYQKAAEEAKNAPNAARAREAAFATLQ